jgi:nitroreductase
METRDAILGRKSTRAFLPDAIDEGVIRTILDEARWAPSWGNSQDCSIYVITGDALKSVKAEYVRRIREGEESPTDFPMPFREQWPAYMQERMNLTKPGETFRPPPGPSIWEMYGAPCLLAFAVDDGLASEYACFDAGALVENVCIAAHDVGLATVIMAVAVRHPDVLRSMIPEAANKRFVVGVALGLAMRESPATEVERKRADLDDIVTWVS